MSFDNNLNWKAIFQQQIECPGYQWLDGSPSERTLHCRTSQMKKTGFSTQGDFVFHIATVYQIGLLVVADSETWEILWTVKQVAQPTLACGKDVCVVKCGYSYPSEFRDLRTGEVLPIKNRVLKNDSYTWCFAGDYALTYERTNFGYEPAMHGLLRLFAFQRDPQTNRLVSGIQYDVNVHDEASIHGKYGGVKCQGITETMFWCVVTRLEPWTDCRTFRGHPQLMVFDNVTRERLWSAQLPEATNAIKVWVVCSKTHLICAMDSKHLLAFNIRDGSQTCELPLASQSAPLWLPDGRLLIQANSRKVRICTLDSAGILKVDELFRVSQQSQILPLGNRAFLAVNHLTMRMYDLTQGKGHRFLSAHKLRFSARWTTRTYEMDPRYRWITEEQRVIWPQGGVEFDPDDLLDAECA